jgi:FlaA1/EpsC-like NDP-sugar epimerase
MSRSKPTLLSRQTEQFSSTFSALLKNLSDTGRGRKQMLSMTVDGLISILALWLAYSLRLDHPFSDFYANWYVFILMPITTVLVFGGFGVYRWVIRSTNQRLFRQLLKCCLISSLTLLVTFFLLPPTGITNPRSLFVIYGLLLLAGTGGMRLLWRSFFDVDGSGLPIAIYGAGSAGEQFVRLSSAGSDYRPMVFIDDDPSLEGSTLSGLPVLAGGNSDLKSALKRYDVNCIILAMPSLSSVKYQQKLKLADELGYPVLTMPSVSELVSGTARVDDIRDVSINDILGRSEVKPDVDLMCRRVTGKVVLVTGGGGSIGSELCRQVMKLAPKELLILDNCEANLYYITEEFKAQAKLGIYVKASPFMPVLGSVTDERRINALISDHAVDTVFHAAAYKHVPIIEAQPDQGVETNVFGTAKVLEASIKHGVDDFVLISTDKAVRPTNAMGASKRVAELILQARARTQSSTRISMVRFGNVLGSSGSVVPKFKKQIQAGGPITLTHTDITRYFMTIPEAAQLVLQAGALAKGGDVFVLDMGEPVRIEQLATSMVRLYGKKLKSETGKEEDIAIVVEGLRPGEKMYEELFITDSCSQTEVAKISTASEYWMSWERLEPLLAELKLAVLEGGNQEVRSQILSLAFMENGEEDRTLEFNRSMVGAKLDESIHNYEEVAS